MSRLYHINAWCDQIEIVVHSPDFFLFLLSISKLATLLRSKVNCFLFISSKLFFWKEKIVWLKAEEIEFSMLNCVSRDSWLLICNCALVHKNIVLALVLGLQLQLLSHLRFHTIFCCRLCAKIDFKYGKKKVEKTK